MTEKFDPNATPICDKRRFQWAGSDFVCAKWFSEELERRSRIAEEKLRIAEEILLAVSQKAEDDLTRIAARCALQKIAEVGK